MTKQEILREKLQRRLERACCKAAQFDERYSGREQFLTFHGGYNQGYWDGRVSGLESAIDFLMEEFFIEYD